MAVVDSRDALINAANARGAWNILNIDKGSATVTAALTTCGYLTARKFPNTITLPTITSPSTEVYCTYCRIMASTASVSLMCGKLINLGNINMNTGTYTSGSSMPTNTIAGLSLTTSATHIMAVVTTALTATTPTLTITYTDQGGNTGQTATLVLPTSPVIDTTFLVSPHLANADSGVRAITACTKSAGTAGVITFYGVQELGRSIMIGSGGTIAWEPVLGMTKPRYPLSGGDVIGFFCFGSTANMDMAAMLSFTPN